MVPERDEEPAVTTTDDVAVADLAPALAVAAVARRLGVAPATLRTWDRRYGLGPSEHSAGAHRRYSAVDVDRLLVMRRLTLDGVAPGEAARVALATDVRPATPADGVAAPTSDVPRQATALGRAHLTATPTDLVDAALAGDPGRCARLLGLDGVASRGGVAGWWTALVEPALSDLARRTVVDTPGVDAELTLRSAALEALRVHAGRPPAVGAPVVLVLVPPGEPRPLVTHALAAALAAEGSDARIVGGPVGPHHAVELVVMTRAVAVVTVGRRHDPDLSAVARLAHDRPDVPQFVMVPAAAWDAVPVERSVHVARSFTGLLHEVLAVAGRGPTG
ncbi:MerR family transcriptional regulator [Cellulomonas sp.]|uniref:MerR family transcriptional regulator n=1 Tax=Cellulomonas sp. TaxID=40001 RepID=UPI001B224DB7|nr:MerR family transcriptional regulator [Cellulomonas sp.]MBO9554218.1 MerR family transcriptional regulator [Cellulomonas sp.]